MPRKFIIFAFTILLLSGCDTKTNRIENAGFENWTTGPDKWRLEGEADVRKAEGSTVELAPKGAGAPFLYQRIKMRRLYKGNTLTLSAMVKSSVPENAAIEFSDRKGRDVRSPFHPGDGRWHILKVTMGVPETAELIEVRLRNFKSQSALYRSPVLITGTGTPLKKDDGPASRLDSSVYAAAGLLLMAILILTTHIYIKGWRSTAANRIIKGFLILIVISNMILIAGRPAYALYTSAAAWAAFFSGMGLVLLRRCGRKKIKEYLLWITRNPASAFVTLSVLSTLFVIFFLYQGSTHLATRAARLAYIFMLLGAAAAMLSRLAEIFRAPASVDEKWEEREGLEEKKTFARRSLTLLKRR